jgi:type VI secretion system protein ImpJ
VIPLLTQLLARADAPPHALFLTLAQFAGQLAAFAAEDEAVTCPAYDPGDLRATFDGLFAALRTLLDVAVARRVTTMALDARVDGMHLTRIADARTLADGGRFLLAVQSDLTDAGVYELVPRVGKVASWAEIPRYLEAAASAVPIDACLRPPREVPLRAGKYHFVLDAESPAWQAVVRERALAVHLPPPFDPRTTRVELIVIPGH